MITHDNSEHNGLTQESFAPFLNPEKNSAIVRYEQLAEKRLPTMPNGFVSKFILEPAVYASVFLALISPGLKIPQISKTIIFGGGAALAWIAHKKYQNYAEIWEPHLEAMVSAIEEYREAYQEEYTKLTYIKSNVSELVSHEIEQQKADLVLELEKRELELARAEHEFEKLKEKFKTAIEVEQEKINSQLIEKEEQIYYLQDMIKRLNAPKMPVDLNTIQARYCADFIKACLVYEPQIVCDCYERQPQDNGLSYNFWVKLRDNKQAKELLTDEFQNWIALQAKYAQLPYISIEHQEGCIGVEIPHSSKYKAPKRYQIKESLSEVKTSVLKSPESLLVFVENENHLICWGASGDGKTTFQANLIGAIKSQMGSDCRVVSVVPKIDSESPKLFEKIDYIGFGEAIFGLLDAATECQYRNEQNTGNYLAQKPIKDWEPILYLFDEYSEIASAWNSCDSEKLKQVVEQFKSRLDNERLEVFERLIEPDLNHRNFANRLLLFIWRVGRSLKIKSAWFGQNMMPSVLNVRKNDFTGVGFICLASSVKAGVEYRVNEIEKLVLENQHTKLLEIVETEASLKYHSLLIPTQGKPYFAMMPSPGAYGQVLDNPPKTPTTSNPVTVTSCSDFQHASKIKSIAPKLAQKPEIEVWKTAPRTLKGTIKKTEFYKVWGVKDSNHRKIISEFVEYLEAKFG